MWKKLANANYEQEKNSQWRETKPFDFKESGAAQQSSGLLTARIAAIAIGGKSSGVPPAGGGGSSNFHFKPSENSSETREPLDKGEKNKLNAKYEKKGFIDTKKSWFQPRKYYYKTLLFGKRVLELLLYPKLEPYQNPRYIQENVYPKHAKLRLFESKKEALTCGLLRNPTDEHGVLSSKTRTVLLNSNKWRFKLFQNYHSAKEFIVNLNFSPDFGREERVPSQWQLRQLSEEEEKMDCPIYTNFTYPMEERSSKLSTWVPKNANPTAIYSLRFDLPDEKWMNFEEEALYLILHGVGSCVEVFVDGHRVGYGEDSMTEKEFEITSHLTPGSSKDHVLTLIVSRYCSGSYLEDQDMWRFSGIHRDVELQRRLKSICMWDYEINTSFENASLDVTMDFTFDKPLDAVFVRTTLFDTSSMELDDFLILDTAVNKIEPFPESIQQKFREGEKGFYENTQVESPICSNRKTGLRAVVNRKLFPKYQSSSNNDLLKQQQQRMQQGKSNNPVTTTASSSNMGGGTASIIGWSSETPVLYTLLMEVFSYTKEGHMEVHQVEMVRVGFRDVSIREGQLLLNGRTLTICGVNRHEHDVRNGKVLSEKSMVEDVLIMKRNNINAVRTSHYPNMQRFYEICDFFGIYVFDEANIETHGFMLGGAISLLQYDPAFSDSFLSRCYSMVMRTRNHACVICYSLGNESGFGPNMAACARLIRKLDPSRPVAYEGGLFQDKVPLLAGDGGSGVSNIIFPMYHTPRVIESHALKQRDRPVILCEYAHCMGNSGGGLHLYWNLFRSENPNHGGLQGGFIWDFVDQNLTRNGRSSEFVVDSKQQMWNDDYAAYIKGKEGKKHSDDYLSFFLNQFDHPLLYGGDFGPTSGKQDAEFCMNGLLFANRLPHPAMHEAKHLMQPLTFSLVESKDRAIVVQVIEFRSKIPPLVEAETFHSASGEFHKRNSKHVYDDDFKLMINLSMPIIFKWNLILSRSGEELYFGKFFGVHPVTGEVKIVLDLGEYEEEEGGKVLSEVFKEERVIFQIHAVCSRDLSWANQNHVMAYESFELIRDLNGNVYRFPPDPKYLLSSRGLSLIHDERVVIDNKQVDGKFFFISTTAYTAKVDCVSGCLVSMRSSINEEEEIFGDASSGDQQQPYDPFSFFRAPVDNDRGGVEKFTQSFLVKAMSKHLLSEEDGWRKHGLDCVTFKPRAQAKVVENCICFQLTVWNETNKEKEKQQPARELFHIDLVYEFLLNEVLTHVRIEACASLKSLRTLPRIGSHFVLNPTLVKVQYFGRGPHENYSDRKASAKLGVFTESSDNFFVPYVSPQENGARCDVRWVQLCNAERSFGVCFSYFCDDAPPPNDLVVGESEEQSYPPTSRPYGTRGAQMNLSRFTVDALDKAKHLTDLIDVPGEVLESITEESVRAEEVKKLLVAKPLHLILDTAHCGVGGDLSWLPSIHSQYYVSPFVQEEAPNSSNGKKKNSALKPARWTYQVKISLLSDPKNIQAVCKFHHHYPKFDPKSSENSPAPSIWAKFGL